MNDPIEEHATALAAALHGPAGLKARMVGEIRDGLADAVAARTAAGMPDRHAAHQAVREFGTIDEIAPGCQRELTVAQARHTARALALTVPFLFACWYLIWAADHGGVWDPPGAARLLGGVAAGTALLAATALAATGILARRLPMPHVLPRAVAWTGTAAGVAMAIAALALVTASLLAANWPLTALAGALAAASHAVVATSARACRRCAHLPVA